MRINNRFIKHAPKRGPNELNIELKKLKIIKIKRAINHLSKTIADAINGLKNALAQVWGAISSTAERIADVVNNYTKYKKEDNELFNTLPSVRRFEHSMV